MEDCFDVADADFFDSCGDDADCLDDIAGIQEVVDAVLANVQDKDFWDAVDAK